MKNKIANYSTEVPSDKSVSEIHRMLSGVATAVMVDYENGEAASISFRIDKIRENGGGRLQLGFRLPCDWKRTLKVMHSNRTIPPRLKSPQQARRVAWRIVRDWLRAQLSLIEIDQVDTEQALLPYAITPSGETLYERIQRDNFVQLSLPAPTVPTVQ